MLISNLEQRLHRRVIIQAIYIRDMEANERELERFVGDSLMACIAIDQYPQNVIEVVIQVIHGGRSGNKERGGGEE